MPPLERDAADAAAVTKELQALADRLFDLGIDPKIIITAFASEVSRMVEDIHGSGLAPAWFQQQADVAYRRLMGRSH